MISCAGPSPVGLGTEVSRCRGGLSNYIYGVVQNNTKKNFSATGIDGMAHVYCIHHRDLAAVVSDYLMPDPGRLTREELVRYLFAHQLVIEKVMQQSTIIPFKFGTAVGSAGEVERILEVGYHKFRETLEAVENKVELDVVATWNKDYIFHDIAQEPEIKRFKQDIGDNPEAAQKIKLGQMVEAYLSRRKEQLAPELVSALAEVSQDFCNHDTLDATMIINTAFLTLGEKQEAFDQKLEEIDRKHKARLNFRRVGPLPAYSFCTAVSQRADAEQIERARRLLGLGEEATSSQIKQAYWDSSSRYHPDRHPGDTVILKKFEAISKAYQLLTEYCRGDRCCFREASMKSFITVDILRMGNGRN